MDALSNVDPAAVFDQGMAVVMGLALASTCGIRAFLPLLAVSVLAWFGKVELGDAFAWMGSPLAILCFATAVLAELVGDKIPAVDHALDAAGVVVKPVAATLTTASMVTDFDPMLAVALGLMTGGVAAEGVHLTKAKARLMSTAFTGSIANPILSVLEDIASFFGVILAVLLPLFVVGATFGFIAFVWLWRRSRRPQPAT